MWGRLCLRGTDGGAELAQGEAHCSATQRSRGHHGAAPTRGHDGSCVKVAVQQRLRLTHKLGLEGGGGAARGHVGAQRRRLAVQLRGGVAVVQRGVVGVREHHLLRQAAHATVGEASGSSPAHAGCARERNEHVSVDGSLAGISESSGHALPPPL
jgi:hypothetical protein